MFLCAHPNISFWCSPLQYPSADCGWLEKENPLPSLAPSYQPLTKGKVWQSKALLMRACS